MFHDRPESVMGVMVPSVSTSMIYYVGSQHNQVRMRIPNLFSCSASNKMILCLHRLCQHQNVPLNRARGGTNPLYRTQFAGSPGGHPHTTIRFLRAHQVSWFPLSVSSQRYLPGIPF